MIIMLLLMLALVLLDLLAVQWGMDSTDDIDSTEWEHRYSWRSSTTTD